MLDGVRHRGEEGQEFSDEHACDGGLSTLYKVSVSVRWRQAQGQGGAVWQCGEKLCAEEGSAHSARCENGVWQAMGCSNKD